ncbi:nucleotidyltransferase family protein [Massilia sp. erpn]|uniref:nucleotidyltransferase family protein n=1 Tax=Massilia sp. erpn TaxID=2738142 RepID=UPI0021081ECA|nr:nucleotidyltransferase family protein [Massilia sp. erpn]
MTLLLEQRLAGIAAATPWFMDALHAAASFGLESWCIGAGVVRNLVWDHLHGYAAPSQLADIDLAYFDAANLDGEREADLQRCLSQLMPSQKWEVTNQARVHLWFEQYFGHPVDALTSLDEAVASWPEYATSVGVFLDSSAALNIIAPHGLEDLFSMTIRRNPARVSLETYRERIEQKQYLKRWPQATVIF